VLLSTVLLVVLIAGVIVVGVAALVWLVFLLTKRPSTSREG